MMLYYTEIGAFVLSVVLILWMGYRIYLWFKRRNGD